MTSVDIEKVEQDCQRAVKMEPIPHNDDEWDSCYGDYHSQVCETWGQECLSASAKKSSERLWRIPLRYLFTTCARDPAVANDLEPSNLSGMTQDSCIYPTL